MKQQLREFSAAWSHLDEIAQRNLLPEVLQVLDPPAGTIAVALRADTLERLRERISAEEFATARGASSSTC